MASHAVVPTSTGVGLVAAVHRINPEITSQTADSSVMDNADDTGMKNGANDATGLAILWRVADRW